jgi:hypothetical protein
MEKSTIQIQLFNSTNHKLACGRPSISHPISASPTGVSHPISASPIGEILLILLPFWLQKNLQSPRLPLHSSSVPPIKQYYLHFNLISSSPQSSINHNPSKTVSTHIYLSVLLSPLYIFHF